MGEIKEINPILKLPALEVPGTCLSPSSKFLRTLVFLKEAEDQDFKIDNDPMGIRYSLRVRDVTRDVRAEMTYHLCLGLVKGVKSGSDMPGSRIM